MSSGCRILVVDDDRTIQVILARSLKKAGYQVRVTGDGPAATKLAIEWKPDLILLDMLMPGVTGLEVCSELKANAKASRIPVIFVTAASEKEQVLEAFSAGGCDYVTKPFIAQEVLARVEVHTRLYRTDEQLRLKNVRLQELTEELARLSRIDPLTKLLNRRSWDEAVAQEHERFRRTGQPYSIAMIDVDHFKAYNDSCGHQAGDECLRRVADAVRKTARAVDSVGRYGGEEFVVLASETRAEAGLKLAERIRKAVWGLAIPHPASAVAGRITVSAGVAMAAAGAWDDVLRSADDALYIAKRAGRNMAFAGHATSTAELHILPDRRVAAPQGSNGGRPDRLTVLVVDDEPTNRAVCKGCLTRAGYRVLEAADGQAALACANDDPPDVIVMDVVMPHVDGLECTRRLRANPETRDVPIIILSALTNGGDISAGLEAGADEYVMKPVRTTELVLRVRSMARLHCERADMLRSFATRGEHVRILVRLVDFCRQVGLSCDLQEIVDCTVAAIADVALARRVSIMLPEADGRVLCIVGAVGIDNELAGAVRVPVGAPIAGQVFTTGQAAVVNSEREVGPRPQCYDTPFFASVPLLSAPLGAAGSMVGVLNVTERVGGRPFESHELEYIELMSQVAGTAIDDVRMRRARDQAWESVMVALAKLAEYRDNDTSLHVNRVTKLSVRLAETLREKEAFRGQITDEFLDDLGRAVPLHDIGKVSVPDHILLHPGRFSDEQMEVMRTHTVVGANTIQSLVEEAPGVSFLAMAADIARYHHERWDGSGYPAGLRGNAIPLAARIVAVADVYDAVTTQRVYREAQSHDKAVAIIVEGAGTQFDRAVVDVFVQLEHEFAELAEAVADDSETAPASVSAVDFAHQ